MVSESAGGRTILMSSACCRAVTSTAKSERPAITSSMSLMVMLSRRFWILISVAGVRMTVRLSTCLMATMSSPIPARKLDGLGLTLALGEAEALELALGLKLALALALGEVEALALALGLSERLALALGETEALGLSEALALALGLSEALGLKLAEAEALGEREALGDKRRRAAGAGAE
jgi:hypothetical protein